MRETFDHTADLGLRVRAADLPALFAEAGMGLAGMIVEDFSTVRAVTSHEVALPPDELELLFFDWLKALLSLFEAERLLCCRFDVALDDTGLRATAWGETWDESRHEPAHEVKAITYHGLKVEKTPDGWLAEVVVDI
ncbi:MAG: archease [Gemmataceae bacterium]|nr:archease [Gemmataceae bacterium]